MGNRYVRVVRLEPIVHGGSNIRPSIGQLGDFLQRICFWIGSRLLAQEDVLARIYLDGIPLIPRHARRKRCAGMFVDAIWKHV